MDNKAARKRLCLRSLLLAALGVAAAVVLGLFLILRVTGIKVCQVHGESMMPTVEHDTKLLLNPSAEIGRFDIAVFELDGKYVIKRVIGMPGDTVSVKKGVLFVNGEWQAEPYLYAPNCRAFFDSSFDVKVPEGEYFLMGDNRDNSADSRDIGTVPKSQLVGVPIWSFEA